MGSTLLSHKFFMWCVVSGSFRHPCGLESRVASLISSYRNKKVKIFIITPGPTDAFDSRMQLNVRLTVYPEDPAAIPLLAAAAREGEGGSHTHTHTHTHTQCSLFSKVASFLL